MPPISGSVPSGNQTWLAGTGPFIGDFTVTTFIQFGDFPASHVGLPERRT